MALLNDRLLLSFQEAAKEVPNNPHWMTVYRWSKRGCRGVILETVRIGNRRYVPREALKGFIRELSTTTAPNVPESSRKKAARKKSRDRQLDALLGRKGA